ncbi:MAG: hypothetical protein V4509_00020 [Patescibacteria group bacterium]
MSIEKLTQSSPVVETKALDNTLEEKMELERGVMGYGCEFLHITEEEWVKFYGDLFAEMFQDPNLELYKKFKSKEVYDRDPKAFYQEIQEELFKRFKQKDLKDQELVKYM